MIDTSKYICPKCGGKCAKRATVYFSRYDERTDVFELFACRICEDCAYEWVVFERTLIPAGKKEDGK